jgi:hypothetical protein
MNASIDPRESTIRELHKQFVRTQLRILIGNGISIGSGLPAWDELNEGLLKQLVESDARYQNQWATLLLPQLPQLSQALYTVLGREGAADFVKLAKPKEFLKNVASVLYGGRDIASLPLTRVHFQLASMSTGAPLATTNFDPLVELAIATLRGDRARWSSYRTEAFDSTRFSCDEIEHLHGWLDPGGKSGGDLVLTEGDYFELARNANHPANKRLRLLFAKPGAALVVGMSMADVNIRRLLYLLSKKPLTKDSAVYLVVKQRDPLIDSYTQEYWSERKLHLIFVEEYEELPGLLRDIQWGPPSPGELPGWLEHSLEWIENHCPPEMYFDADWQQLAHASLDALKRRIVRLFAIASEEQCQLTLFVPVRRSNEIVLSAVATSRAAMDSAAAKRYSMQHSLNLARGREQGLAAIAFSRGLERQSLYGDNGADFNFTAKMKREWVNEEGYRDWRSVLALPVFDSPFHVPVTVVTLTSNLSKPFWAKFEGAEAPFRFELFDWVKTTSQSILGGPLTSANR